MRVLLIAMLAAGPALAGEEFPIIDVEASCRKAHGRNPAYAGCIDQEQERYDLARSYFDHLTDDQKQYCGKRVREASIYQYSIYGLCVANFGETNLWKQRQERQPSFRY